MAGIPLGIVASSFSTAAAGGTIAIVDTDIHTDETGNQAISLSVNSGDLVVVGASASPSVVATNAVTGGSLTWTHRAPISSDIGTSNGQWHCCIFTAVADTTGTLNIAGTIPNFGTLIGYAIRNQAASFLDAVGTARHPGSGGSTTQQINLADTTAAGAILGFIFNWDIRATTPISPFVKNEEVNYAVGVSHISASAGAFDPGVTVSPAEQFVASGISIKQI